MAPAALIMTMCLVPLALLLALSTRVLAIISTIGVLLALLLFVTGDHHNGSIFLLLRYIQLLLIQKTEVIYYGTV